MQNVKGLLLLQLRGRHRRILACRGSGCRRRRRHRPTGCRHRVVVADGGCEDTGERGLVLEQKAERRLVLRVPGAAAERLDGRLHERRLR